MNEFSIQYFAVHLHMPCFASNLKRPGNVARNKESIIWNLFFYSMYKILVCWVNNRTNTSLVSTWPVKATFIFVCNIYRTRKRSLPWYQNTEKCVEKRGRRPGFFNNFEVFWDCGKELFRVLYIASQTNQYLKWKLKWKLS